MTQSLENRVSELELRNIQLVKSTHRIKQLFGITIVFFAVFVAAGAMQVPAETVAKKFSVIDANGNVRIGLGVGDDGASQIFMFDANRNLRLLLVVEQNGDRSILSVRNVHGIERVNLGVDPNGNIGGLLINGQSK